MKPDPSDPSGSSGNAPETGPVTLWQTVQSVAAAMFGVQSSKNRRRDFSRGRPLHFIVIGILMVGVLVITLVLIVKFLLHRAGL